VRRLAFVQPFPFAQSTVRWPGRTRPLKRRLALAWALPRTGLEGAIQCRTAQIRPLLIVIVQSVSLPAAEDPG
jgi:hypothetical protein